MAGENEMSGSAAAIIPAGGVGRRFGPGQAKQFAALDGWPVLAHTLSRFEQTAAVDRIILVTPAGQVGEVRREIVRAFGFHKVVRVVPGGETRQDSVAEGFLALEEDVGIVVVHDGVRPLVRCSTIEAVVETARQHGAAIAAASVRDSLKRVENGVIQQSLDRRYVWQAQTPQAFRRDLYAEALARARADGFVGADDAALIERLGRPVRVVEAGMENIKITMPEDLVLAETMMTYGRKEKGMRIGMGFDLHRLVEGRKLMLGGVEVPFDRGLEGHSDADALIHALIDALFGAAGLGDIGRHFQDNDAAWAGASGLELLESAGRKVAAAGYELVNADLTLMAEAPRIKDLSGEMIRNMAAALDVDAGIINVKATTAERLGPVGREEGLAATAVALLVRRTG